jgi:hypothetical protein
MAAVEASQQNKGFAGTRRRGRPCKKMIAGSATKIKGAATVISRRCCTI